MTVNKREIPKEAPPKPVLIEDLGMMFPTKDSNYTARFGIYKCGLCGNEFRSRVQDVKSNKIKSKL